MENVDLSLLRSRILELETQVKEQSIPVAGDTMFGQPELKQLPPKPNQSGGGDGMDTRIINLERDMADVRVSIGKVETRLQHIEQNMVTRAQMAAYAVMALVTVLGAGWWIVQTYLAPILVGIGKA